MLLDSFYENRAPVHRLRGVSRLNTRLSFYAYECRKLRYFQTRALPLFRTNLQHQPTALYLSCFNLETIQVEYTFK